MLGLVLGIVLAATPASAQDSDGVYGRFDADTTLSAGIGGGAIVGDADARGSTWLELRARYLDAVGFGVTGEWLPGEEGRLTLTVEARPLFPALFLTNAFSGSEWLDLLLQSFAVEVGTTIRPLEASVGAALAVGVSVEVPVLLPSVFAHGLFLRLGALHQRSGPSDRAGPEQSLADWRLGAALTIHGVVDLGLAGRELPRYRPE